MKKYFLHLTFLASIFQVIYAQDITYLSIYPDSLKESTNAIVKENIVEIDIVSYNKMNINKRRVVTVFNEVGLKQMDANEYFSKSTTVKNIEAIIYNSFGQEIKKIKQKDFKENSLSQGSIITDDRILYLDYTPTQYPFTLVFESGVTTSNTAFIPSWSPIEGYFTSTINSKLIINYSDNVKLKYKEFNFDNRIKKLDQKNRLEFSAQNIKAYKAEQLSPAIREIVPYVLFGLDEFEIEGVKGYANDWSTFGNWMYKNLLSDTEEIPESTKTLIKNLIGEEKDQIEISKIIYKYVQDKTRYVSIQLGIGGWRPMLAKDVDRLGYGDCKALTNYTRSLLKAFNIPSYYAVVYGDRNKRNIQENFVSMQGNHVILGIPKGDDIFWLECTSQSQPFGFQGDFTDDRNVLIVSENKTEIIKTKTFSENDNLKMLRGSYQINENGSLFGKLKIVSKGLQYDWEYGKERLNKENQIKKYKEEFDNINNLKVKEIKISNNRSAIEFTEELELEAERYAQNINGKLMFAINAFSQNSYVLKKYKERKLPFEVQSGYTDDDEIEIEIPTGFIIEASPNEIELDTEFGYYKTEYNTLDSKKIIFKRKLIIKKGFYEKTKYESYRIFRETISKNDNLKILITKI